MIKHPSYNLQVVTLFAYVTYYVKIKPLLTFGSILTPIVDITNNMDQTKSLHAVETKCYLKSYIN